MSGVMIKTREFDSNSDSSLRTSSLGTRIYEIVYREVTGNGRIVDGYLLCTPRRGLTRASKELPTTLGLGRGDGDLIHVQKNDHFLMGHDWVTTQIFLRQVDIPLCTCSASPRIR